MLKILQASLQQYMNRELPDVQAGFTNTFEFRNFYTEILLCGQIPSYQTERFCYCLCVLKAKKPRIT